MSKIRTSAQAEHLFIGEEPTWDERALSIPRALSWYANQMSPKDSKKFTLDYLKSKKVNKEIIEKVASADDERFNNLGFVCRIIQRGAEIDRDEWINIRIKEIISSVDQPVAVSQFAKKDDTVTIQDRIYDQCSLFIDEIENYVDQFIKTKKSVEFSAYDWMIGKLVKAVHAKQIAEHFKPMKEELQEAINKTDEQLVEGYSLFKKMELKKFYEFISGIIDDCGKIVNNSKVSKKPRKKKAIPLEKKVAKVKYKKDDIEFQLVSINPAEIIGARQLWVFNVKTKKLGLYISTDDSGFSVKGSSVEGFDENLSIQKTLRKPLEILSQLSKAKKVELRKLMGTIKGKDFALNGRLNGDTILIKALK
jgi:hypothetical protein